MGAGRPSSPWGKQGCGQPQHGGFPRRPPSARVPLHPLPGEGRQRGLIPATNVPWPHEASETQPFPGSGSRVQGGRGVLGEAKESGWWPSGGLLPHPRESPLCTAWSHEEGCGWPGVPQALSLPETRAGQGHFLPIGHQGHKTRLGHTQRRGDMTRSHTGGRGDRPGHAQEGEGTDRVTHRRERGQTGSRTEQWGLVQDSEGRGRETVLTLRGSSDLEAERGHGPRNPRHMQVTLMKRSRTHWSEELGPRPSIRTRFQG